MYFFFGGIFVFINNFSFIFEVSGSAGSVNIELYRVDSKIVKLIKTCSSFIALTPTTSLNAAGSRIHYLIVYY